MKRTCNGCLAFTYRRNRCVQGKLSACCELGYEVETIDKVTVKDLHNAWFGKPMEECPKPKTQTELANAITQNIGIK